MTAKVTDTDTEPSSNTSRGRLAHVITIALIVAGCAAPSRALPSSAAVPTLNPLRPTAQPTPTAIATRSLAAGARELADQVLLDIDAAIAIEHNTPDDREFTEAIAVWFASELDYLGSNQAVLASNEGFLPLMHQLQVIESLLTENDPLVLRGTVREHDDAREALETIR